MCQKTIAVISCLLAATLFIFTSAKESGARAGSGSSFGSRGSRTYSRPAPPPSQSTPYRQSTPQQAPRPFSSQPPPPPPQQAPQPAGGGFFRNMAGGLLGGIAGGLVGGMLFRSLGFGGGGMDGGWGGAGGSGIGFFDLLLIGGAIYLVYRYVKNRREFSQSHHNSSTTANYHEPPRYRTEEPPPPPFPPSDDLATGIARIRQFDPCFDEQRFCDQVMDIFFAIQSAWMNRDLSLASAFLTPDVRSTFQYDIDRFLREKTVNHLENIAVRKVEIAEAWQESGQDYLTTLIYANLLDYTTDDATGQLVGGSKTDPVKFEEYWTFTRPVGNNQWQLTAINQK